MKIIKKYDQYRRDFYADMECEKCGHKEIKVSCYDDANFYENVIPDMHCKSCGESKKSMGLNPDSFDLKYPEHLTV